MLSNFYLTLHNLVKFSSEILTYFWWSFLSGVLNIRSRLIIVNKFFKFVIYFALPLLNPKKKKVLNLPQSWRTINP